MVNTKTTPHKARLTTLYVINLYIFRYLAQNFLVIRQYACKISVQSDEKSDCVSAAQSLCCVALKIQNSTIQSHQRCSAWYCQKYYLNSAIVTPSSPSPKTPSLNVLTDGCSLRRLCTAALSSPVPLPWIIVIIEILDITA